MKRRLPIIIAAALAIALITGYLFLDFVSGIKGYGEPGSSDAIVVLTGGKGRAEEGLKLLRKGRAGVLVLSGVNRDADVDSIFLNRLKEKERESIILEKNSRSTYENAIEVRRIMEERGLNSMVLITSGYHMKRALFIFRRVMPPDVEIRPLSVSTPNFDEARWWTGRSLGILAVEFMKYNWYVVRFGVRGSGGLTQP